MGRVIVMPKLGLTMTEGKIFEWFKKEGDSVKKGEKLFVVETDKLTNDIEATIDGVIRKIIHQDGVVEVLKPVGIIADADEDITDLVNQVENKPQLDEKEAVAAVIETGKVESEAKKERVKASPKAKKLAKELGINLQDVAATGKGGSITEQDVRNHETKPAVKVKASPVASKVASSLGIDLNQIQQSGRIMKKDVVEYWNFERLQEMAEPKETRQEMSVMRKVISERMSYSQSVSATVNYNLSVDTREMQRLRAKLKPILKVSYTDIIVKILARVLLEFPLLNATLEGSEIIMRNYVNMGVAVALEDGLIVPVVKFANSRGMESISEEIKTLAGKARSNSLESTNLSGGTFTVTNLGMFNMESFTPIINQPEVAILGINTIKEVAKQIDGEVMFIPMMNLSLTADHRVVDGAVAARFMNRVKEYMENPSILIL